MVAKPWRMNCDVYCGNIKYYSKQSSVHLFSSTIKYTVKNENCGSSEACILVVNNLKNNRNCEEGHGHKMSWKLDAIYRNSPSFTSFKTRVEQLDRAIRWTFPFNSRVDILYYAMFKQQFKISFLQATYNNLGSCEEKVYENNSCFSQCRAFDFEKLAVGFAFNNWFTTINSKKRYGFV